MNSNTIASRRLNYRDIDTGTTGQLVVEIYEPYLLQEGMVDFKFSLGTAGCSIRIKGIGTEYYNHETYGVDTLQALQLASNVESILKRISKKYELFFEDGEPYFE